MLNHVTDFGLVVLKDTIKKVLSLLVFADRKDMVRLEQVSVEKDGIGRPNKQEPNPTEGVSGETVKDDC